MNEQEKEINLKRLLYKALKNWRTAAVVAIIGAVVLGGTKCTVEMIKIHDPEVIEERQTEYEGELAEYEQRGVAIERAMEEIETSTTQQQEYNEKSVLMTIDPYNEWNGSIDFYIETDYQIMPDMQYQNQNIANQIISVYSTYISNGELYQYVIDRMENKLEIRFLREILSGSVDGSNYLLHFTVRGASEEACRELLTLIEEGVRAKQPDVVASVGEFTILTTNNSTYSQINYSLEQSQKANLQVLDDWAQAYSSKKFEYLEWERDEKEIKEPVIDTAGAIKSGIKMAILAGLILGVVVVLGYGMTYVLSKYVQDREAFAGWGVYVAELPENVKKRPFRFMDRLFGKWFLGDVKAGEYDVRLAAAAKQIAESAKLTCEKEAPVIVLVGDVPDAELEKMASAMQSGKTVSGAKFVSAGNPLLAADAIEKVLSADVAVLVAKQGYSYNENVYQIKSQLTNLQKTLVGVVLTEADAMV